MNKLFTRIFILVCTTVLFTTSSVSYAASGEKHVWCIWNKAYNKVFEFTPDYELSSNDTIRLEDTTTNDGYYYCPAGNAFTAMIELAGKANFRIQVYTKKELVYNESFFDVNFIDIPLPYISSDTYYSVWITALDDLILDRYMFQYTDS